MAATFFRSTFYYAFIAVSHIEWDWLFVFTDVENRLYDDYFFGESHKEEVLTIDEAVEKAEAAFSGYSTTKVIMLEEPYNTFNFIKWH